jgi:hypothetical protein
MRQEVERKIAKAFVKEAIKDGYAITVDYGDGPSKYLGSTKSVLAEMFQGDEDFLQLHMKGAAAGWVQFIYGNDGWDVISDYSVNLEYLMGPANAISKRYEG